MFLLFDFGGWLGNKPNPAASTGARNASTLPGKHTVSLTIMPSVVLPHFPKYRDIF